MLTHKIEGVFNRRQYSDEVKPMLHPAGEYEFLRRDNVGGITRYAISIRPNSPKLKRVVSVNMYGRNAEVEAQLDMVEEAILHNALFSKEKGDCNIKCI